MAHIHTHLSVRSRSRFSIVRPAKSFATILPDRISSPSVLENAPRLFFSIHRTNVYVCIRIFFRLSNSPRSVKSRSEYIGFSCLPRKSFIADNNGPRGSIILRVSSLCVSAHARFKYLRAIKGEASAFEWRTLYLLARVRRAREKERKREEVINLFMFTGAIKARAKEKSRK